MTRSLVIVESPAKAKTINKYLGKDFIVKSSVGHIRDLPTSAARKVDTAERTKTAAITRQLAPKQKEAFRKAKSKEHLIANMGINPEDNWSAHYEILPGKEKVVQELAQLAKQADTIYLATDLDREGEAIAWHLKEAIGGSKDKYKRVIFNEITKTAIQEAFKHPQNLDMNRVNAQQARRFLDRVVGYMLSPLLWAKIARGLSAGRVQSVAVRLLVEREREIRAFIPEEYWEIAADLATQKQQSIQFYVVKYQDSEFRPTNKAAADKALADLRQLPYKVTQREDKPTTTKPNAPFITSTLQQAASTRLGFSVKKTMMLAQRLYESGYITYMRTDSTNLSADAVTSCRHYIEKKLGVPYLPEAPNSYKSKEGAQEAHEAIRPSDVLVLSDQVVGVDRDAVRLYDLIWRQFVACQMTPAKFLSTTITIKTGDYELRAKGRVLQFNGFLKILPAASNEDVVLPDIKVDQQLQLIKLIPSQHFTKAPPRYSEAALVRELEKRGIGRPSTYASIISTIQERGYATVKNRRFYAEKMGDVVTDRLTESFQDLMDYSFTAQMEELLDEVARGKIDWKQVLNDFYKGFSTKLETAASKQGMRGNEPTLTTIACPKCGRPMQIRTAATGVFLSCSGYALPPKERCKSTLNLIPGEEVVAVGAETDEEQEARLLRAKRRCKLCGSSMEAYLIDEQRKLHVCGNNPDCPGYEVEIGQFKLKGYEGPVIQCDKCGADMQLKTGRFGKYFGCTSENCKNTRKLLRSGEAAPPKTDPVPMPELRCEKTDDYFILRDGAAGLFLAASQFPKHRETRAPLVEDLVRHKKELDPKWQYLAAAPTADTQGNKAIIRFSRKTKQHYVMSEHEGKPTKWQAYYQNGKWVEKTAD